MTKTHRHHAVRDAIVTVCRSQGIRCSSEPTAYQDLYTNGHKRPDILFHVVPPIATDVTVVNTVGDAGVQAQKAAHEKCAAHTDTVAKLGHRFIPTTMETFGHLDQGVFQLTAALAMLWLVPCCG